MFTLTSVLPLALLALGGSASAEIEKYHITENGVAFYSDRRHNVGTFYYVENTTTEPRCAAWTNYAGQTPVWFRLAPHEKRLLGQGVVIIQIFSSTNLARC